MFCNRAINSRLDRRGETLPRSPGKMTIGYTVSCQQKSQTKAIDTYQLQERGEERLRTRSSERRSLWIFTIIVVDDTPRYLTRKVIGSYSDGAPCLAISGAFHANGVDVWRGVRRASRRSTGAALLTSGIPARWFHRCLVKFMGEVKGIRRLELGWVGG